MRNDAAERAADEAGAEQVDAPDRGPPAPQPGGEGGDEQHEGEHADGRREARGGVAEGDERDAQRHARHERVRRGEGQPADDPREHPEDRRDHPWTLRHTATRHDDRTGEDDSRRRAEPEDGAPVGDREHRGAEHRPEDGPELLHGADDAERHSTTAGRPEVGDEREGRRDEAAAPGALDDPPRDEHRQLGGQRRDDRPDDEDTEAGEQHPPAVDDVGDPADQRQHRDVAEEEPGDDGRRALQRVDADADAAHHVGEGEDDDVGVGGGERDGDGRGAEQRPRGGRWQRGRRTR